MKLITRDRNKLALFIWCFVFGIVAILLLWKAKFGYADLDEAFYLTIPYRFILGDKILFDEWSNTQLSAVPLMPILKLYISITGGTTGIYLFIRYLYTILKCVVSIMIYVVLKKFSNVGAMITSIAILIYSGYGLMVLSYNSLAIGGLSVALLLLIVKPGKKYSNICYMLSGIMLSVAVLGIPYLAILYFIYVIAACSISIRKKCDNMPYIKNMFSFKTLGLCTIGILIMVFVFVIYVLTHTSLNELMQTIPYILNSDTAHPAKSIWKLIPGYIKRILMRNTFCKSTFIIYGVFIITCIIYLLDKLKHQREKIYMCMFFILTFMLLISYAIDDGYINYIIFAPNILAACLMLIRKNDITKTMFWSIYVPGIIFSFIEYVASNTGFVGIASASSVSTIASIMIIYITCNDLINVKECRIAMWGYMCCMIAILLFFRMTYIFWEEGINKQTELLNRGPQAGLMVSREKADYYNSIMDDTEDIRVETNNNALYVSDQSLYLTGAQRYATYSSLCYGISDSRKTLYDYYEQHKDKIPDIIYVDDIYEKYNICEDLAKTLEMSVERKQYGYILRRK